MTDKQRRGFPSEAWIGVGVAMGVGIGIAIGAVMDNIGVGIAIGVGVGIALGIAMRETVRREGKGGRSEDPPSA